MSPFARAVAFASIVFASGVAVASCSLGNISHDDCKTNDECSQSFGLGSTCKDGFCEKAPGCKLSSDCRAFGYLASCQSGACAPVALDPRCHVDGSAELVSAIDQKKGTGDAVLIGALFDLSPNGPSDATKENARAAAAELAIDEINVQGGTRPFGLVVCDYDSTTGDFSDAVELGTYLANDVGVPVIVGPSPTQAASDLATVLYQDLGTPTAIVSPAATGVQLTSQPDHVPSNAPAGLLWRTTVNDTVQASYLSTVVSNEIEATDRVGVLYVDEQYGTSYESVLRQKLTDPRVSSFSFTSTADIASAVTPLSTAPSIKAVVVVSNEVDLARAVLDACAADPALAGLKYFLTDGSKDPAIAANPTAAVTPILNGLRGTAPRSSGTPGFFDRVQQKTGFDASQFSFIPQAYDAAYVSVYGVVYAEAHPSGSPLSGTEVADGIAHLSIGAPLVFGPTTFKDGVSLLTNDGSMNVEGASGPLDFDANGDVDGSDIDVDVWCVKNGAIANGEGQCPLAGI